MPGIIRFVLPSGLSVGNGSLIMNLVGLEIEEFLNKKKSLSTFFAFSSALSLFVLLISIFSLNFV